MVCTTNLKLQRFAEKKMGQSAMLQERIFGLWPKIKSTNTDSKLIVPKLCYWTNTKYFRWVKCDE